MNTTLFVLGIPVVLLGGFFAIGVRSMRRRHADVAALVTSVTEADVPTLVEECLVIFRTKLGRQLSLDDIDGAAAAVDDALAKPNRMRTLLAFERPGHPGWFVRPLGAFLGELLRTHAGGRWRPGSAGGLEMTIGEGKTTMTLHPFDKIVKQRSFGSPGDLVAYVRASRQGAAAFLKTEL